MEAVGDRKCRERRSKGSRVGHSLSWLRAQEHGPPFLHPEGCALAAMP